MAEAKIYQAITQIMGEINAVGKNKKNQQQGFMYRGIDDVMNAINPALTKYHVFIVPEILEQTREERTTNKGAVLIYSICKIRFRFYAEDGSYIDAVTIGEGMDSGDKATNKAMAIAFKYACFQVFCIPTEEMKGPDAETPPPSEKANGKAKSNEAPAAGTEKIDEMKVKTIREVIKKKGLTEDSVYKNYKAGGLDELTLDQWTNAMKILEKYPDKA